MNEIELTPYQVQQAQCLALAEQWERAAETARVVGEFELARQCTEHSVHYRWLAGEDQDVHDLFNGTGRWAP